MRHLVLSAVLGASLAASVMLGTMSRPPSFNLDPPPCTPRPGNACTVLAATREVPSWPAPLVSVAPPALDRQDHVAALEAVHLALSDTEDGGSYIWRGMSGRVSGVIQPTSTFRDGRGLMCRHLIMLLTAAERSRRAEGIACRAAGGLWTLEG